MAKNAQRAKVSERALIARINRKGDCIVRKSKQDSRSFSTLGTYYVIDLQTNFVVDSQIDLEAYAREVGALKDFEELSDE